jgi:hypothetical protein
VRSRKTEGPDYRFKVFAASPRSHRRLASIAFNVRAFLPTRRIKALRLWRAFACRFVITKNYIFLYVLE